MLRKLLNKIKNTHFIYDYSQMWPFVKPYWGRALLAMLLTLPVGALDAVIAWSLKPYMDVMMIEQNTGTYWIPLVIVIFSALQSFLTFGVNYANTWVGGRIAADVKITLYEKLLKYETAFFDSNTSGNVIMRFNKDVDDACAGLLNNLKLFFTRFYSSLALIGVLFYNSWQLALIAVAALLGALFPLTKVRKRIKDINQETVFTNAEVMTHYNETFGGSKVVCAYNLYDYQNQRFSQTLRHAFKLGMKMVQRTGLLSPMMHFMVSLGIALVIWAGSYLILSHQITAGNFVSFVAALILLYTPIKGIGNTYGNLQIALMAMERIFELLKKQPVIDDNPNAVELTEVSGSIEYQNVGFEYVAGKPVLENVNLCIKKGETVALVGNSGGGKSTLVSLLPRFYDVTSGQILLNGKDIRQYSLHSLRDKMAIVFQDNYLFNGTIRENILLGKADATEEEINRAIEAAYVTDFLADLPSGLDTQIGERGVLLSGGQKQRIAIARAFLKNAPIVILDEATSALDNKSEAMVQKAIDNLMADRTVIVIAHRLSTVRHADKIVVVNYGKIVETGTHEELVQNPDSIYGALYQAQLK